MTTRQTSAFSPEVLKQKLVNWLRLAVQNGYGDVYYGKKADYVKQHINQDDVLANEEYWTDDTREVFDRYVASLGQQLNTRLRMRAYGKARATSMGDIAQTTFRMATTGIPASEVVSSPEFLDWYWNVYMPRIYGLGGAQAISTRALIDARLDFGDDPGDVRLETWHSIYTHNTPQGTDRPPPAAVIDFPDGSKEQISYTYARTSLARASTDKRMATLTAILSGVLSPIQMLYGSCRKRLIMFHETHSRHRLWMHGRQGRTFQTYNCASGMIARLRPPHFATRSIHII